LSDPGIEPQPVLKTVRHISRKLEFVGTVSREGKVEGLRVTQSAHPEIDKLILAALAGRVYEPSRLPDGRAFSCGVKFTVEIEPSEWLDPRTGSKR
jgi:hypothetical protein